MSNSDLFFDFSTQELRDFITEKISFTSDAMVDVLAGVVKLIGSNIDHQVAIIVTAPVFTSTTGVYEFKCSVFDETINKPMDIEFSIHTGFIAGDGYYYFKTEIFETEYTIRMDEMIDKETIRKIIADYNRMDSEEQSLLDEKLNTK